MTLDQQNREKEIGKTNRKSWKRRLLFFFLFLLFFLVGLVLLLQLPAVQKWGAQRIAQSMSNQLGVEVSIKNARASWFNVIELQGILIRDHDQDTMIYANRLTADFYQPIRGLFNKNLIVEALDISDAYLNIKFKKEDDLNNLNLVFKGGPSQGIDSISSQVSPEITIQKDEQTQLYFLKHLNLNRVRVRNFHEPKGKEELFYVRQLRLASASFDPVEPAIIADELFVDNLQVDITNFDYDLEKYDRLFVLPFANDTGEVYDPYPITLTAKKARLINGEVRLQNLRKSPIKLTAANEMDWRHLDLREIEIVADSLYMKDWIFGGVLHQLKAKSSAGLNIVEGSADYIRVTEQRAVIRNMELGTNLSNINGDLTFIYDKYPDFRNFQDDVRFDFRSRQSSMSISELLKISPKLKENLFFAENSHESIALNGRLLGYINNLKGRSIRLRLGDKFKVVGLVDIRDFTDPERTRINLDLQDLTTDMQTIRRMAPTFRLPSQFDKLGNLSLSGEFNGLLKDFISSGRLQTDLGEAVFNINLNSVNGIENAIYGGQLKLNNFNLKNWTGDDAFGYVSMSAEISEGKGLTAQRAVASLSSDIRSLTYNGYDYQNAKFTGLLNNQLIKGEFSIQDENIDLFCSGDIALGARPKLDVSGNLAKLDAKALRLLKKDLFLSSTFDIDISDLDPDRFTGNIFLTNFEIGSSLDSMNHIDSLSISSFYRPDSTKSFLIQSDVADAQVNGDFRIMKIPMYFTNYFSTFNSGFADKLGLKQVGELPPAQFNFDVEVHNSLALLSLITKDIDTVRNLHVDGYYKSNDGFYLNGRAPKLSISGAELTNPQLYLNAEGAYANLVTSHDGIQVGKFALSPLTVFADLESDTLFYVLNEVDFQTYFDHINVEGKLYLNDGFWQTQLYESELQIFGEDWAISDDNFIRFGQERMLVEKLNLSHEQEYIKIKSINEDKGLAIEIQDLPINRVNGLIQYDKLIFDGLLSGKLQTSNLSNMDGLAVSLVSDDIIINTDTFGKLEINANSTGTKKPIFIDLGLIRGNQKLLGQAEIMLPNKSTTSTGSINSQVTIEYFPASIIEYFVTNGLSNTTGVFHGSISGVGDLNDPEIVGDIFIPSSSFQIDILGTTYYLNDQKVHVNSDLIDVTGVTLRDRMGNPAIISGGITHHNLAKLGFAAYLESDEILVLETTKEDNELYYGTAFASVEANFDGTVFKPVIRVEAENKPNSSFVINNDGGEKSGGLDFILFDFDTIAVQEIAEKPVTGVDFTLDMKVNPDLHFQIILDESTRDIIQGQGNGDLILRYSPAGELSLFGEYVIDRGQYLFTYSLGGLVPINKPFTITKGGKLQWSGDPYGADIDLRGNYNVVASPYNLLANQISGNLAEDAKQKTDVRLELQLRGKMLHPDIDFDILFPELTGQLKNALDIELARIRADETEIQRQAASLIVFRDFASSDLSAGSSVNVVANTISEFLSNQVSYYLTGLVEDLTRGIGFIDDIEFDVGYRLPSGEFNTTGTTVTSEVGVSTRLIMFDRRLELSIKGDYVNGGENQTGNSSNFFNTDLEIDYILTSDRRWRLRAYSKQDQFYNDRRSRFGMGVNWRREYDNLDEYKAELKRLAEQNKEVNKSDKGEK